MGNYRSSMMNPIINMNAGPNMNHSMNSHMNSNSNPLMNSSAMVSSDSNLSNSNYNSIAKDFLERFLPPNSMGQLFTSEFFYPDALITFKIHANTSPGSPQTTELISHDSMKTFMYAQNMAVIRYYGINHTSQPIGKFCILICIHGKAEIHSNHYSVIMNLVLKIDRSQVKITNKVLEIF